MTTYGYARVSTRAQSNDSQEDYLTRAGAEQVRTERASGGNNQRPIWNALLEELTDGDELVVTNLDRISRNAAYLLRFQEEVLEAKNITLVYDNHRHDPRSRSDRLQYAIKAAFAEDERLAVRERTTRTLTYKRSKGEIAEKKVTEAFMKKVRKAQDQDPRRKITSLAKEFGVSRTTIRRILSETAA